MQIRSKAVVKVFILLLCNYFLLRLLFIWCNHTLLHFESVTDVLMVFFTGLRFDLSAIAFSNALLFVVICFPLFTQVRRVSVFLSALYVLINAPLFLLNFIDIGYFPFTQKRITADFFQMAAMGDDVQNMLPSLFKDYWYLLLLFIGMLWLNFYLIRKISSSLNQSGRVKGSWVLFTVVILLLFLFARGGLQYKPINILSAAQNNKTENTSAVLNTTFSVIKTIGKEELKHIDLTDIPDPTFYFNPIKNAGANLPFRKMNVVIIIMESFSKEYIGYFNDGKGYTPFLDSLALHGLMCLDAYANGKKSIEGIPAIVSGIPALMTNPYISGSYNGNKINSIASLLKPFGYQSAFFHGGNNGTMGFDNFSKMAGYDYYIGRNEYGNANYDGTWGVYDGPFMQFFCQRLNEFSEPFVTTFFSLSSHHPYAIPDSLTSQLPKGDQPIYQALSYADYSLRQFFNCAQRQSWFNQTIFVITADHTGPSFNSKYQSRTGIYAIPILYYIPSDSTFKGQYASTTQQIDIVPTILDYMHYPEKYKSFGNSILHPNMNSWAVNYINGYYQFITPDVVLRTDFENDTDYVLRSDALIDSAKTFNQLKVIVGTFNNAMIKNKLKDFE